MFKKDFSSMRKASLAVAAAAAGGALLMTAGPATAATVGPSSHAVRIGHVSSVADTADDLQAPVAGMVYTGAVDTASGYSPQFGGPIPTPTHPNPPTQYVHITAGDTGATVATSLSTTTPRWSSTWVLPPGQSTEIPVQSSSMVGIANVPSGTPESFTVTSITASY